MSNNSKEDSVDYLIKVMEVQGASAATVQDGHILMFKRSFLQGMMDKYPDKEAFTIFLQRSEFKN